MKRATSFICVIPALGLFATAFAWWVAGLYGTAEGYGFRDARDFVAISFVVGLFIGSVLYIGSLTTSRRITWRWQGAWWWGLVAGVILIPHGIHVGNPFLYAGDGWIDPLLILLFVYSVSVVVAFARRGVILPGFAIAVISGGGWVSSLRDYADTSSVPSPNVIWVVLLGIGVGSMLAWLLKRSDCWIVRLLPASVVHAFSIVWQVWVEPTWWLAHTQVGLPW